MEILIVLVVVCLGIWAFIATTKPGGPWPRHNNQGQRRHRGGGCRCRWH